MDSFVNPSRVSWPLAEGPGELESIDEILT